MGKGDHKTEIIMAAFLEIEGVELDKVKQLFDSFMVHAFKILSETGEVNLPKIGRIKTPKIKKEKDEYTVSRRINGSKKL